MDARARSAPGGREVLSDVSEPAYWNAAYADHDDGWELGVATPPLVRALAQDPRWVPPGERALVLGCGRGHEARLAATAGWRRVVGVDFAASAITEATAATPPALAPQLEWRRADLFTLAAAERGAFDLVIEHTSLCAIDPARRAEWFAMVAAVLAPGGALLALFYPHARPGGPPFGATRDELTTLATAAHFAIERAEVPADSIARRAGDEWLALARVTRRVTTST